MSGKIKFSYDVFKGGARMIRFCDKEVYIAQFSEIDRHQILDVFLGGGEHRFWKAKLYAGYRLL